MRPLVLCLQPSGSATAERVAACVGGDLLVARENVVDLLQAAFLAGRPILGVCAAGILIRALAPLLADKTSEPPVVAVAEDASSTVPLLGGHRGANGLARDVARALDCVAAVTTAGDLLHGTALDDPPAGWRLADPEHARTAMAALLQGASCEITGDLPDTLRPEGSTAGAGVTLTATERPVSGGPHHLVYHPMRFALGVGCARDCTPEEMAALVAGALADAEIAPGALAGVFSIDLKADEPAVHAVAERYGLEARFFDAGTLEKETPRLAFPSDVVFAEVGCHGVAEAAALAAVGAAGALVLPKCKSRNATCALARAERPLTALPGRRRGRLALVGLGPGKAAWRTPEASRLIARSDELVGYGLYLDLLGPLARGIRQTRFPLGGEEDRCRHALERAGEGAQVALVCSGDAGIYAMGALVFELLDRGDTSDAARRVEIVTTPGISALQAAAALAGAPLGHDFCTISLSDLLTPWPVVEQRIRAAALGDFVVAFYNPVSRRRRSQLGRAKAILLEARPPETPVVLATDLGRPGQRVRHRRLADLDPNEVDMLTLVLVGSSETRSLRRGDGFVVYTPRGYAAKMGQRL